MPLTVVFASCLADRDRGDGFLRLERCFNIHDVRKRARTKLPAPLFHYLDGGADDEWSLENNSAAFSRYPLLPSQLVDVGTIDMRTRVLGVEMKMPLLLSPTGMSRLFHHEREPAVARAAARAGILYSLSTLATTSIEDIGRASTGPKMFQLYMMRDRGLTREFIDRCREARYDALCLTVDTAVAGNRERDRRWGMVMPPRLTATAFAGFAARPGWTLRYLLHPGFDLANLSHRLNALEHGAVSVIDYVNAQFDRSATWDQVSELIAEWAGPFAIKGLQSPADALRAHRIGASAIMVSNHGGRQLDGTAAPVDCIRAIRDAIGDDLELIVDGGVRRGTDIVKALALGATACSFGRPYLYGLAANGERGVTYVMDMMREEIARSMALLGKARTSELCLGDLKLA